MVGVKIERSPVNKEYVLGKNDQEKVEWVLNEHDLYIEQKRAKEVVDGLTKEMEETKKASIVFPLVGMVLATVNVVQYGMGTVVGAVCLFGIFTVVPGVLFYSGYKGASKAKGLYDKYGIYKNIEVSKGISESKERLEHFRPSINGGQPIGVSDEVFDLDNELFAKLLDTY